MRRSQLALRGYGSLLLMAALCSSGCTLITSIDRSKIKNNNGASDAGMSTGGSHSSGGNSTGGSHSTGGGGTGGSHTMGGGGSSARMDAGPDAAASPADSGASADGG